MKKQWLKNIFIKKKKYFSFLVKYVLYTAINKYFSANLPNSHTHSDPIKSPIRPAKNAELQYTRYLSSLYMAP